MDHQTTTGGPAAPAAPVKDRFPTAYTILFALIAVMAAFTWVRPAGQYQRAANVALGKDAPVPGTYQVVEAAHQGVFDVVMAPINGFYSQATGMANAIDLSLFVLIIGGFLGVVTATGAINTGIDREAAVLVALHLFGATTLQQAPTHKTPVSVKTNLYSSYVATKGAQNASA